ncbi:MAG: tetratricopeptide repeat protein [Bdellovibrionia bacterium]
MKFLSALLIVSVILTGCLKTRGELSETEEKKVQQTQVQTLQKQKADSEQQLIGVEQHIRSLNGRIETLEHDNEMLSKSRDENTNKISMLEARIKALEDGILQLKGELDAASAAPPPVAKKPATPVDDKKGPYEQGEDFFNQKEWKKAITAYQKYLETTPKGENVAGATYKIGVSLAELKMNKEAKVFLEEVVEKFPKSKAARQATFRLNQMKKK